MFVIKKKKTRIDEANEKALTSVCTVHVQKIFALLHAQAVAAAEAKGVIIENTAANGNDAKTAVFHSAGEHMIVARANGKGEDREAAKIDRKTAIAGLKEYIKVFCGEDVSSGIKDDEIFPLPEGEGEGTEPVSESVYSFRAFLSESGMHFIKEAGEDDEDEAGEEDDEEDEDKAGEDDNENNDAKQNGEKGDESVGYYILYGLKIKGLKETTAQEALKNWGSNFLKGFGVKLGSMWGGGGGEAHTLAGLVKGVKGLFGAISDPDELCDRVEAQMKQKFPEVGSIRCEFRDRKTLIKELDKNQAKSPYAEGWPDGKNKQKINSAEYSMYIHVQDDDLKEPFVNRKVVANMVTMQIKGLFKKFKNMIKADDVIYIKGSELHGNEGGSYNRNTLAALPTYLAVVDEFYFEDEHGNQVLKKNVIKSLERINTKFVAASKNKKITSNEDAKSLIKMWEDFYSKHSDGKFGDKELKKDFLDKYREEYNKFQKKFKLDDVSESVYNAAYDMMSIMFESGVSGNSLIDLYSGCQTNGRLDADLLCETKLSDYIEKNKLTKEQALSTEHLSKIKAAMKVGEDVARQRIDKYFQAADSGKGESEGDSGKGESEKPSGKSEKESNPGQDIVLSATNRPRTKTDDPKFDEMVNRVSDDFHMQNQLIGQKVANFKTDQFDGFSTVDTVRAWLKYIGLDGDFSANAGDHKFAFVLMLKTPKTQVWKNSKNGKKAKPTTKSSWGYSAFNEGNVKKAMEDSIGKDGRVTEFFKFKPKTANEHFRYNGTKVPADTEIYVGFVDELQQSGDDVELYFAVTEDPLNPDPKKVKKLLNDGKPVKQKDLTDDLLSKLQEQAEDFVSDEGMLSEAEEEDEGSEEDGDGDGEDEGSSAQFEKWEPDPKTASEKNGEVDGKPAVIICAKFKKGEKPGDNPEEPEPKPPEPKPTEGEPQGGDDLYIIPMPGVKYDDTDDEGFTKTI